MDFWATLNVLGRRWYVSVPAFVLTMGLIAAMYLSIPTRYVSQSVILLTQPPTGPTVSTQLDAPVERINPLLNFRYGLSEAAAVVVQVMNAPGVVEELVGEGDAEVQITNGTTNLESFVSGPLVFIEGNAGSVEQATAVTERAAARVRVELGVLQERLGADPATYITLSEIVPPTAGVAPTTDAKRPIAAVLAIGLFATLGATFAAESIMVARSRRRSGEEDGEPDDPGPVDPVGVPERPPTPATNRSFVPVEAMVSNGVARHVD